MGKRRESGWMRAITVAIVRPTMGALTRRTWRGQDNVPRQGGVIIAANHLSMSDPLTISHFLYIGGRRWPTFMAKEGVFRIPVVGTVARLLGQIPVHRGGTEAGEALKEAEIALTRDDSAVIVYPEGTCTRDPDLWPMVAKTGVARMALSTGAPVVPLAHWGEQYILPYGTKRFRPFPRKRVTLVAGPPVDLSAYDGQPLTSAVLRSATADIMREVTGLQAEIRGEEPPAVPFDPRRRRDTLPSGSDQASEADQGTTGGSAEADKDGQTGGNDGSSEQRDGSAQG